MSQLFDHHINNGTYNGNNLPGGPAAASSYASPFFNAMGNTSLIYPSAQPPTANAEHMMGTTIIAASFNGGVVLGADSRTSTGSYVANRVSDKITEIYKDSIFCCRSGSAADTQAIADIVKYYLKCNAIEAGTKVSVSTAATVFKDLCYDNKDRLQAGIIVAGWDNSNNDANGAGKGHVYAIPLGGALIKQPFALGGSGSTYIYGFIDSFYQKKIKEYRAANPSVSEADLDYNELNISEKDCTDMISTALSHAMARDAMSGGVVRMAVITKDGVRRLIVPGNNLPYLPEKY